MTTTRTITIGEVKFSFTCGTDSYGCRTWAYGGYTIVERGRRDYMVTDDASRHGYTTHNTLKGAAIQVLVHRQADIEEATR